MQYPKKIYVELTTRCNLQCSMCVKYAPGSCIPESDMELGVFQALLPSLAHADTVILNGIGESLMHPNLLEIIGMAHEQMAVGSSIGLQSNGLLLNQEMAQKLIVQGLSTLCLSVDSCDEPSGVHASREHSFTTVKRAINCVSEARKKVGEVFTLGLEIVLTLKNIDDLPELVSWAAGNDVDYILTSHLILYGNTSEAENLFYSHSPEALSIFKKYNDQAASLGFDFIQEFKKYRTFAGTRTDRTFADLLARARKEAMDGDIQFNFDHFDQRHHISEEKIERIFSRAKQIADKHGVDIVLPSLQATAQRNCPFISDDTVFIAVNGDVMPCHFLWHTYSGRVLNENVQVHKRVFGNIDDESLESIWQTGEYVNFREEAGRHEYARCWTCPQGPCPTLVNDQSGYANDCYGSQVPCGHCQWNLGGVRCL